MSAIPPGIDEAEPIDPDDLYRDMLRVLSQVSTLGQRLRDTNQLRGQRVFFLYTRLPIMLPGIAHGLAYLRSLTAAFEASAALAEVAFLVERAADDVEIAVEAMLGGRHSVVVNTMRDHMEIQMLLADFTADISRLRRYIDGSSDDRRGYFGPGAVRRRVADHLHPGQSVDLPDAVEYGHHCLVVHPTPEMIGAERLGNEDFESLVATEAEEIVEHVGRVAFVADELLAAVGIPEESRPPGVNTITPLLGARKMGLENTRRIVGAGHLAKREPTPRKKSNPPPGTR